MTKEHTNIAGAKLARRTPIAVVLVCLLAATQARAQQAGPEYEVEGFQIFLPYGGDYRALWESLDERIERIRGPLGQHVLNGGEIHVLPDLNLYFTDRGQEGRAPRWAQGLAIPARRLILLRYPDPQPANTLTHELSHLAVHEAAGGNHVPYWFLEGFAIYQAEEWGPDRAFSISVAALFGNTLDFADLDTSFPPHQQTAGLAYAQSFHLVSRLLTNYGEETIRSWLQEVATGTEWEVAFRQEFGVPPLREYRRWERSVRVWYAWVPTAVSFTTLWAVLGVFVLWMRRRIRMQRQEKLATMAASERELYGHDPDDDLF